MAVGAGSVGAGVAIGREVVAGAQAARITSNKRVNQSFIAGV